MLYPLTDSTGRMLPLHFLSQSQQLLDLTQLLSKLLFIDLIPPLTTPPSPTHLSSPGVVHAPSRQTLAVISTAAEMPEVMDTLVKRYQSLFL